MSNENKIDLNQAYAVETPEDNVRLYADWAETYEADFVAEQGYVAWLRVAEQLARHKSSLSGAVLDVGCGTGIGGAALRRLGFATVDGIDISTEMLAQARRKCMPGGEPVYRNLMQADLTGRIDIENDTYAGLVSAGTFTHGHLGPESLDELWRIAAPAAICAIGINRIHFFSKGFNEKFAAAVASRTIAKPDLIEIDVYENPQDDVEPGNEKSMIVVCRAI